jgi:hypothetical protein
MTSNLQKHNTTEAAIEKAVLHGDLRQLTEVERLKYNFAVCRSLGLNPLTRPIDYITDPSSGKLSLYINAIGMAQLRQIHRISTQISKTHYDEKEHLYSVTAIASDQERSEESTAIVVMTDKYGKPLTAQQKANAMMKCETKAKRRATLALCGVPWGEDGRIKPSEVYDPPIDTLDEIDF